MIFIDAPILMREVQDLLWEGSCRKLQQVILVRPEAGHLIQGSGGLRKLRWDLPAAGNRGSRRTIYYWDSPSNTIYLLLAYKKSKREDLTQDQLKTLSELLNEWLE